MGQDLFKNSARAKLDQMGAAMRVLHKALIDHTQHEYERTHVKVKNPYQLFAMVAQGKETAVDAVRHTNTAINDIYAKWKRRSMI